MTSDTDRPFEADEADVIDQHRPIIDDGDDGVLPADLPFGDADPADVLDQHITVPVDDDWPTGPSA